MEIRYEKTLLIPKELSFPSSIILFRVLILANVSFKSLHESANEEVVQSHSRRNRLLRILVNRETHRACHNITLFPVHFELSEMYASVRAQVQQFHRRI